MGQDSSCSALLLLSDGKETKPARASPTSQQLSGHRTLPVPHIPIHSPVTELRHHEITPTARTPRQKGLLCPTPGGDAPPEGIDRGLGGWQGSRDGWDVDLGMGGVWSQGLSAATAHAHRLPALHGREKMAENAKVAGEVAREALPLGPTPLSLGNAVRTS